MMFGQVGQAVPDLVSDFVRHSLTYSLMFCCWCVLRTVWKPPIFEFTWRAVNGSETRATGSFSKIRPMACMSLFVFATEPFTWLLPPSSLVSPIGLLLGLSGLWHPLGRSAVWSIVLGTRNSLYIPTIWLFNCAPVNQALQLNRGPRSEFGVELP
jgi:hypothetical protein